MINDEIPGQIIPENETIRLKKLYQYKILDTSAENNFDLIALLAAGLFETDRACISFAGATEIFHKAQLNDAETDKTAISASLYDLYSGEKETIVRYEHAQLPEGIKFHVAAPIIDADGFIMGTISVTDSKAHAEVTQHQLKMLNTLAKLVMDQLEMRLVSLNKTQESNQRLRTLAHDLKNPVTAISLYVQLLGSREMKADLVFSMAAKIETSIKRIEDKLNNLFKSH